MIRLVATRPRESNADSCRKSEICMPGTWEQTHCNNNNHEQTALGWIQSFRLFFPFRWIMAFISSNKSQFWCITSCVCWQLAITWVSICSALCFSSVPDPSPTSAFRVASDSFFSANVVQRWRAHWMWCKVLLKSRNCTSLPLASTKAGCVQSCNVMWPLTVQLCI